MTALSPSATKVIIDEEEAEDEATPLKSFKEIEEEKEAEKKREQRFVNTSPLCVFIVFLRICTHYPPCYGGRYLFREIRRILIVIFLLHYLQLKLLSLCGPLDQNDALMLILDQIPETHIRTLSFTKYTYICYLSTCTFFYSCATVQKVHLLHSME